MKLSRRYRWVLVLAVVVLLLGLWEWWAHVAHERLQVRLDAIAAQGEPLTPTELKQMLPPSTRPSGTYIHQAITAMDRDVYSPSSSSQSFTGHPPFPPAWEQMTRKAIEADAGALSLLRQARGFGETNWAFADHNGARALANILVDAALYAHVHGDDSEAVERILDIRHLAQSLDESASWINHLVAMAIESLANERLEILATELRFDSDKRAASSPTPTTRPASRNAVAALIDNLLDEPASRACVRLALLADRVDEYQTLWAERNSLLLLRPMADLEIGRVLDDRKNNLDSLDMPNWPAAHRLFLERDPAADDQYARRYSRSSGTAPSRVRYSRLLSDDYLDGRFRSRIYWIATLDRRMAAISLAVQLYRADHDHWPARLDDLVPHYLPRVPLDPFDASEKQIRYETRKSGEWIRPMLKSRSPDHSVSSPPPDEPQFDWEPDADAQWRDLSLPPPGFPLTKPALPN